MKPGKEAIFGADRPQKNRIEAALEFALIALLVVAYSAAGAFLFYTIGKEPPMETTLYISIDV